MYIWIGRCSDIIKKHIQTLSARDRLFILNQAATLGANEAQKRLVYSGPQVDLDYWLEEDLSSKQIDSLEAYLLECALEWIDNNIA